MIPPISSDFRATDTSLHRIIAVSIWSTPLEFIYEYGLFLAQAVTFVAAVLILVAAWYRSVIGTA